MRVQSSGLRVFLFGLCLVGGLCEVVAGPTPALAQERRLPLQELIRTEVVYPQERGELQFTFGSSFDDANDARTVGVPLSLEYGLTEAWQVGVEWVAFTRIRPAGARASSGAGSLSLGTKYSLMDIRGSGVHAAFGTDLTFHHDPRKDGDRETGRELEPFVALAADLADGRAQIFGSAGVAFASGGDDDFAAAADADETERELEWNVGALVPRGRLTFAAEFNVRQHGFHWRDRELYVTPSITVHLPRTWEMGIGAPLGLTDAAARFGLVVHVLYER